MLLLGQRWINCTPTYLLLERPYDSGSEAFKGWGIINWGRFGMLEWKYPEAVFSCT